VINAGVKLRAAAQTDRLQGAAAGGRLLDQFVAPGGCSALSLLCDVVRTRRRQRPKHLLRARGAVIQAEARRIFISTTASTTPAPSMINFHG